MSTDQNHEFSFYQAPVANPISKITIRSLLSCIYVLFSWFSLSVYQVGHDAQAPRTGMTRIPMSKSLKTGKAVLGSLGISSGMKLESRAESQSMRIEVKKSTASSVLQNGGKG